MSKIDDVKITIVQDTREKKPLKFAGSEVAVECLHTGDYSIKGFEDSFTVEHKTIADLISTCNNAKKKGNPNSNRERFRAELQRMQDEFDFYALLISGCESDILPECRKLYRTQYRSWLAKQRRKIKCRKPVRPEVRALSVKASIKAFRVDYNCHYYYMGDKKKAAEWVVEQGKWYMRNRGQ